MRVQTAGYSRSWLWWVRFNFGVKARRLPYKCLSLIDFWRWGFAPPPKINFFLRPLGAPEIFTPVLKRTRYGKRRNAGQLQTAPPLSKITNVVYYIK
jgi:hypothetical protein